MIRVLRSTCSLAVVAATIAGCVRAYKPPAPNEPHAILKLRRTYEQTAGAQLSETLTLGEDLAFSSSGGAGVAATPRSDAILIHPVLANMTFRSGFSHQEGRQVQEYQLEQVPYNTTETYNCGTGTSYRTCSRSVTRNRTERKPHWVTKTETVDDGSCTQTLMLTPRQGSTYLLQYTYQQRDICALSCFEQKAGPDGAITQAPCLP
jgi:hypothetical protein